MQETDLTDLDQWFSVGSILSPQGTSGDTETFWSVTAEEAAINI